MSQLTKEMIMEKLKSIEDPELRIGLVDLGLIYRVELDNSGNIDIDMTLTSPGCPYGEVFMAKVEGALREIDGVSEVKINLVFDPPWDPKEMASDLAKDELGLW
jgi:metal-sulfur cluster biosynthetic enzyme